MKKVTLTMLALTFAATSIIANTSVLAKKATAKQITCASCHKGQKCNKSTCPDPASCCK